MESSAVLIARSATQLQSVAPDFVVRADAFDVNSTYMSPIKSPLRATVTEMRPLLAGLPFVVCSMFSIAKLVCRLYTAWKKVTFGLPVRYTSWAPYATSCMRPPAIVRVLYYIPTFFFRLKSHRLRNFRLDLFSVHINV